MRFTYNPEVTKAVGPFITLFLKVNFRRLNLKCLVKKIWSGSGYNSYITNVESRNDYFQKMEFSY